MKTNVSAAITSTCLSLLATVSFIASPAKAVSFYIPPESEVATKAVTKQLQSTDMKLITHSVNSAAACGIPGPATVVEVKIASGRSGSLIEYTTIKTYVVSFVPGVAPVDGESCLK